MYFSAELDARVLRFDLPVSTNKLEFKFPMVGEIDDVDNIMYYLS